MADELEYFLNKRPDRTYISQSINTSTSDNPDEGRTIRILSKVFDTDESHQFVRVKGEVVLRITPGGREEVKVVFYEDTREIDRITIQRFTAKNGNPHNVSFTFRGAEIEKLHNAFRLIKYIDLGQSEKVRLDDQVINERLLSVDEKRKYFLDNLDLVTEIVKNHITKSDVVALAYRKSQLKVFEELLHDEEFFQSMMAQWSIRRPEDVWQNFFERNPWIFGYGLNYIFTAHLDDRKLEQITTGYSIQESGKRVEVLLK